MWLPLSIVSFLVFSIAGQLPDVTTIPPDEAILPDEAVTLPDDIIPELIVPPIEEVVLPEEIVPELVITTVPTVTITQGTIVGSLSGDGSYAQFYGIPFADTTSGSNRFKAPNPPPIFEDSFIANRKDIKCVRSLGIGYEGTEDCLVANVFTNRLDNTASLPVMVWVKGKEFDKTYEFEPSFQNFVNEDVVVVTLNFRESVLGFLCLGTETAPGNAGLKDIIAGLRWVQDNIAEFGGNPNDITLVGHGSGASAVDLVTLSPMANGLVHKAIAQSGNALSPWAVSRDNLKYAIQVAEALGHIITDVQELSEIFQRTSVAALMGVLNELDLTDNSLAFAPCLEREDLEGVEPFMIKSPYQSLMDRDFLQIPYITGFVDHEGTIRSEEAIEDNWLEKMSESFIDFLQPDLEFEDEEQITDTAQNIRSFYFRNNPINMDNIENYIKYHGDTMILVSTLREVRLRAVGSTAPVYLYQFSYKGSLGEPFVGPIEVNSAAHSEEFAYMFYDSNDEEVSEQDQTIGKILVERWTVFAKTGQPLSFTSPTFWRPYTSIQSFYLRVLDDEEITDDSTFDVSLLNPHPEVQNFWDPIYEEHFLDAEGKWDWTERYDNDEEEINENDGDSDNDQEPDAGGDVGGSSEVVDGTDEDGNGDGSDGDNDGGDEGAGGDDGDNSGGDGDNSGGDGDDDDENNSNNSASSAIGYTFSIITLFTIFNQFHSFQMLS